MGQKYGSATSKVIPNSHVLILLSFKIILFVNFPIAKK